MIIGFGHKMLVGKDTAANYLVAEHGFIRIGFADAIKKVCRALFSWPTWDLDQLQKVRLDPQWGAIVGRTRQAGPSLGTPRAQMRAIGRLFRRHISPTIWVDIVERQIQEINARDNIVVSDVRFPEECAMIRRYGGAVARIDRAAAPVDGAAHQCLSETALDGFTWNTIIRNNGTKRELFEKVRAVLAEHGFEL